MLFDGLKMNILTARFFVILGLIVGSFSFGQIAYAQISYAQPPFELKFPNNFDPVAREQNLDLSGIVAIRFLTSANYPPFNYRSNEGELVGFNIDLANAICENLQIGCTLQAWPWEQLGDALADFQGDAMIAGLAITEQNGERFDFSQIYMMLPARFVTQSEQVTNFAPNMLDGKMIGVRKGSAHAIFVDRYIPEAQIIEYTSEFAGLEALKASEIYAYFGDGLRLSVWLNQNPDCCEFAGDPYFNSELFGQGMAIAFAQKQDQVRRAINYALFRLKREGVLDELYLRWFPIGFY